MKEVEYKDPNNRKGIRYIQYNAVNRECPTQVFEDLPMINWGGMGQHHMPSDREKAAPINIDAIVLEDLEIRYRSNLASGTLPLYFHAPTTNRSRKYKCTQEENEFLYSLQEVSGSLVYMNHFLQIVDGFLERDWYDYSNNVIYSDMFTPDNKHVIDNCVYFPADMPCMVNFVIPSTLVMYIPRELDDKYDPDLPQNRYKYDTIHVPARTTVETPIIPGSVSSHLHCAKGRVSIDGYELQKFDFYEYNANESVTIIGTEIDSVVILHTKVERLELPSDRIS